MRNLILILSVFLFSACCEQGPTQIPTEEKTALSKSERLVMATLWYQQSAEMKALYHQCYFLARLALDKNIKESVAEKKAVVVDIDETLLDNSPFEVHLINTGNSYTSALWKEWTDKGSAEALPGALDFIKYAISQDVDVFYISNRNVNELEATMKNLKDKGFPNVEKKFVLLREETSNKTKRRKIVLDAGYEIVLFVGDNLTDFSAIYDERNEKLGKDIVETNKADFGTKFIMLPNPMYGEWEGAVYKNDFKQSDAIKDSLRKSTMNGY